MGQTREQFLAERRTGIGGSDLHHVFGLEPYGCSRRLWYDKTGAEPEWELEDEGAIRRGRKLESIIADEYAERTGRTVVESPQRRHPLHPELVVHIDREIHDEQGPGVLEIKTAGREYFFKMKAEGLPDGYILQLQHGMLITGTSWGAFAVLWPDQWQLLHWDVEGNNDIWAAIVAHCAEFWQRVLTNNPPDRLEADDPRCARCPFQLQCQGEAMAELLRSEGAEEISDPSMAALVQEYIEHRDRVTAAEGELDAIKAEMKSVMGNRIVVKTPAGKIVFRPNKEWDIRKIESDLPDVAAKYRVKYDLGALGKAHPELEQEYKRAGTTRPLRIYANNGKKEGK